MKSKLSWQLKVLVFVQGLFALHLAAPNVASAVGSGIAPNNIKDTNYSIPSGAYFVSPDGNDGNSGRTANSPWSVDKALNSAPSGATIVFRGGDYRNVNANIRKKLTLQAYPHEKPWLKGSVAVNGWVRDGGIWRKDGWNYSFPRNMRSRYIDPEYPLAGHRDMIYINGRALKQVASKDRVQRGKFYVDAARNRLYIGDNPAGKTVEATTLSEAFNIKRSGASTVVRGLGFAHYADQAINILLARRVKLENNTFVWNGVQGLNIIAATDITLRGNTFSYNGRKAVGGTKAHRLLLEDNTLSYNNIERFSKKWDGGAIKVSWSDNVLWRRNLVEHNKAHGLWVDNSSKNATIVNNISRYNDGIGIMFEISDDAIIASNVAYKNYPAGIMVYNASGARVYNNTLAQNHMGILIKDTNRNNTNRSEIAQGITWVTRDNVIKNNIIWNTTGGPLIQAANCDTRQTSRQMIPNIDYNAYYRNSSNNPRSIIQWSLSPGRCSVGYGSISAFKSTTGLESNGFSLDGGSDPFFVNASAGDFRLRSGSPASGRGQALPQDIANAVGLPPGADVNMGALSSYSRVASRQNQLASTPIRTDNYWFGAVALATLTSWLSL